MTRPFRFAILLGAFSLALPLAAQEKKEPKKDDAPKPITADRGPIGKLLTQWAAEGTAAGNTGDVYDNRDREHSELHRAPYPQLTKWQYPKEELDRRADWAFFGGVRPGIVFGNSSTSAGAYQGGSNPRQAYMHARGLEALYRQYRGNNLYIYPEHRDHDPGHNGVNDGYGDLYPTNTPYLLISQGSSGSDQPFMRAIPSTLAAFRPEVKKKLAEEGLLMPTIQMILRSTSKGLTDPKEYLTGKAHPSVFEGNHVNDLKMVEMAHEITLETLPPLALVKLQVEEGPEQGRDFFEPTASERHSDTPAVISRVFRGKQYTRTMLVSAEDSFDVNKKPLTYHWVVLRGDPAKINITPKNEQGSLAQIDVSHHDRRPIHPGSDIESNRIDIGVFVSNGKYFSPPAFVTWYFLDHEDRTYDPSGKILEIGYKAGDTQLTVADWNKLFALLKADAPDRAAQRLRKRFTPDELASIEKVAKEYETASQAVTQAAAEEKTSQTEIAEAKKKLAAAEEAAKKAAKEAKDNATPESAEAQKKAEAEAADLAAQVKKLEEAHKPVQKKAQDARKAASDILAKKQDGQKDSTQTLIERSLAAWIQEPDFYSANQAEFTELLAVAENKPRQNVVTSAKKKLADLGMLSPADGDRFELKTISPDAAAKPERLTRHERNMLARFHGDLLSGVLFPGVIRSEFRVNYVPPQFSEPPGWRDVYRYDSAGREIGWTRYGEGPPAEFTRNGQKILTKDAKGRVLTSQSVRYEAENPTRPGGWPFWRKTLERPGAEIQHWAYASDEDTQGGVARTEPVEAKPEEKKGEEKK